MIEKNLIDKKQDMISEVLEGLLKSQKTLPSKYFYDENGSKLFDQITELEEYYPTRTERKILSKNVNEIEHYLGEKIQLIEPGSGSSSKTRILLSNMDNIFSYIPMDISGDYLFKVAEQLQQEYPKIKIHPLSVDYTVPFVLPENVNDARKIIFYPGSTIGNFKLEKVQQFLEVIHGIIADNGGFLIGVDLVKDIKVLEDAYNDKKGITAAFNKNILTHINKEIGANFNLDLFTHKSIWNAEKSRIEMHLIVDEDHTALIEDKVINLTKGETIHTENSHKYSLESFEEIVAHWFKVKKVWTDENNYFSLQYLEPK